MASKRVDRIRIRRTWTTEEALSLRIRYALPFRRFCGSANPARGLSDQDQRHNLTVNYEWDIPTPGSFGATEKALLGGWEAGGILTLSSGTPFTVLLSGDDLGQNNTDPYSYPDKLTTAGCANPINPQNASNYVKISCFAVPNPITQLGNAGRNSVIGPGVVDLDFSLFKNFPIHEALKGQFRAEFFNIINHPNFQSPNDNRVILNPDGSIPANAGAVTLMNTTSRQIQFAMKFTW